MSDRIRLTVHGVPAPQGSKTAYVRGGRAVVAEGGSSTGRIAHATWRQAVATAARDFLEANPRPAIAEPVELIVDFRFPPTSSDPYRRRHVVKPDLDKLVRSVGDSLVSAGLLRDDTLIFALHASKVFATGDEWVGAEIIIATEGASEAAEREQRKTEAAQRRRKTAAPNQTTLAAMA